jgi:ribulose-5-phosphate 4-epimerase/fuculose-1-phosphate aldolase
MTVSGIGDPVDPIAALREEVSLGCRVLGSEDQGELVWGHVSARDPDGRGMWMKASTYGFEEVAPEQVILVDRDGQVVGLAPFHRAFDVPGIAIERPARSGRGRAA